MAKVAIWMGHSGSELGAQGILLEDDVTRQARTWAVAYAKACGHTVTTDSDNMSLSQRINASTSDHVGILEWHANLLVTGQAHGTEVWYSQYDSGRGERIANAMADVAPKYGFTDRGAKDSSTNHYGRLGILDTPKPTAILVELFFLDNTQDVSNWKKNGKGLVEAMTARFLNGLGLKSSPSGNVPETPSEPAPNVPNSPSSNIGANLTNKVTYQKVDADGTRVRTSQTTNSAIVDTLAKGTVFRSDRYADGENVDGKGYKWFERAGKGWVYGGLITPTTAPSVSSWVPQKGKFKLNTAIKLRSGTSTNSAVIAILSSGSVVNYDAYIHLNGYVWIRQPRGNGYGYLATGESVNCKRQNYWGTFY